MTEAAYRFPALQSPARLADLLPGDTHHRLGHYANSDFWLAQANVDILRMPDLQSADPFPWHRRIAVADGRVLSLDRNLPRHEISWWIDTAAQRRQRELKVHPDTFSPHGFTVLETLVRHMTRPDDLMPQNRTAWVPCNSIPVNPSFTCPEQRDAGAMRVMTFRKDGVWRTRYDHRPRMSAPHQMASLEGAMADLSQR